MVRSLGFVQDMNAVRQALLGTLVKNGRIDEAFAYVREHLGALSRNEGWRWLGHALAGSVGPEDERITGLEQEARKPLELGMLRAALALGDDATARTLMARWPAGHARRERIDSLAGLLMLDGETAALEALAGIAAADDPDSAELLAQAASIALYRRDPDTALGYAARLPHGDRRDEMEASAALLLLQADRRADAARLFDEARPRAARSWEHVALLLDRFHWLETRYQGIRDPWRRAERRFQLARQALRAGDRARATRLAEAAEAISPSIAGASTRWLVHAAVAEVLAGSGHVERAAQVAALIPTSDPRAARQRADAAGAIAARYARTGDTARALVIAGRVTDSARHAGALGRAAVSARASGVAGYQALVEAARAACLRVPGSRPGARDAAWGALVQQQLDAGDAGGARVTAQAATLDGAGSVAYETLVTWRLSHEDFSAAEHAARAIPSGMDGRVGYDRRQRALVQVVEAMAASGKAREAMPLLQDLDSQYGRERATAAVADGLATTGAEDEALALLARIRRDDLRASGTITLLRAMLRRTELPDPQRVMSLVPERDGATMCWVVAAATAHASTTARTDAWVAALRGPLCRAFAYAGAAYSVTVPSQSIDVQALLDRVDPGLMVQRMERAMREQQGR